MSLGSTSGMAAKMSALMPTFSGSFALLKFLNAPGYMRMSCRLRATTAAARCCLSDGGSVVGWRGGDGVGTGVTGASGFLPNFNRSVGFIRFPVRVVISTSLIHFPAAVRLLHLDWFIVIDCSDDTLPKIRVHIYNTKYGKIIYGGGSQSPPVFKSKQDGFECALVGPPLIKGAA